MSNIIINLFTAVTKEPFIMSKVEKILKLFLQVHSVSFYTLQTKISSLLKIVELFFQES